MIVDAVVLAGGRSSRLNGVAKRSLVIDGQTLLAHALAAAAPARSRVVVGDPDEVSDVPFIREEPPFSGPAAAVAAGLELLSTLTVGTPADFTLVLACDMPRVTNSVGRLFEALERVDDGDGVIAVDGPGRRQPLAAIYRCAALHTAARRIIQLPPYRLSGTSMTHLISGLRLVDVPVPAGSTADIDTWEDAVEFGIGKNGPHE